MQPLDGEIGRCACSDWRAAAGWQRPVNLIFSHKSRARPAGWRSKCWPALDRAGHRASATRSQRLAAPHTRLYARETAT